MFINKIRKDLSQEAYAELVALATDFYVNVPAGITLPGDWAVDNPLRTFALIEAEGREWLDRIQDPFRVYVDMEMYPSPLWTAGPFTNT